MRNEARSTARTIVTAAAAAGVLALAALAPTACARRSGPPKTREEAPMVKVTSKGYIVASETTYAPTGASIRMDDTSTLLIVGRGPTGVTFYARKDAGARPGELYLHTGKVFYDVWKPLAR